MKKYLIALAVIIGLVLSVRGASAEVCKATNLLPASRTIVNSSTVLSWQINCRQTIYGYFVMMVNQETGYGPISFYSPVQSLALEQYILDMLFEDGPTKYKWWVEACFNPTCTERSEPSVSKTFYQPSN